MTPPVRLRINGRAVIATCAAAVIMLVVKGPAAPVSAGHGDFDETVGVYRIPYANGTDVEIGNDHHTHDPVNRIDMDAGFGSSIVAAASGTIRAVVDFNGTSPNAGDGVDINGNPQVDLLEHSCQDNDLVVGDCADYNNYVWIEHPNGEWTKYTHFGTGTVTANGWGVGDWIEAGEELGLEGDIGRASGSHLHFEAAVPDDPNDLTPFCALGGFMVGGGCDFGDQFVPRICDIPNNLFEEGEEYEANPCVHLPPLANAGGPYFVDEGSDVTFDGTGSSDPDDNVLTFAWTPTDNLNDPSLAQPIYSGIDDTVDAFTLTVYDQIEALHSSAETSVTVVNVPPTVMPTGAILDEGGVATVSAEFTDPGTLDTHTATIDWGDGTPAVPVPVAQLAVGVNHVYGDNGQYFATITITDDDGGVGIGIAGVGVNNLDPVVDLDLSDAVSFPGGDYLVVHAGDELDATAHATDAGSDDLTFTWSVGDVTTYFNNGVAPDPPLSPFGIFPFAADDAAVAVYGDPGVESLTVTVTDDDGGSADDGGSVLAVGNADRTEGDGWWKHQYSGDGEAQLDAATAEAYLEIVNAVSSVFSETVNASTAADAYAVLSPTPNDKRGRAIAALMDAWLQFASGAVEWDATVPIGGGTTIAFLDLMFAAEATILNPASTDAQLLAMEQRLAKVRQAN
jgi:murein DD-endopeptidase MepM/ murein hydrolase activator NlpD